MSAKREPSERYAYLVIQAPDDESVNAQLLLEEQRGILYPVRLGVVTADCPTFLPGKTAMSSLTITGVNSALTMNRA